MKTTNYQSDLESIIRKAQSEVLNALLERIFERNGEIYTLLDNGYNILVTAKGEHFDKIYAQRQLLLKKTGELSRVINMIFDELTNINK